MKNQVSFFRFQIGNQQKIRLWRHFHQLGQKLLFYMICWWRMVFEVTILKISSYCWFVYNSNNIKFWCKVLTKIAKTAYFIKMIVDGISVNKNKMCIVSYYTRIIKANINPNLWRSLLQINKIKLYFTFLMIFRVGDFFNTTFEMISSQVWFFERIKMYRIYFQHFWCATKTIHWHLF